MENSSSGDDGESAHPSLYRFSFLFLFFLLACSKIVHDVKSKTYYVSSSHKTVSKTVSPPVAKPAKKKKKIYLTFDDGPNKGTQNVLDIVQQENVPATFFIVGEHVFASFEQAKTWDSLQQAKNIELCNHSYTHALHNRYETFYKNTDTVVKDIELTKEKLLPDNDIVRAPGRNSWRIDSLHYTDIKKSKAAIDSLQKAGFIVVGWDLEWHYDPKTFTVLNTADELLNQVDSVFNKGKTKTADNLVLLAHDQVYQKSDDSLQLREFVQKLKQKNEYELLLVSSYPGVAKLIDSLKTRSVPGQ
ncbi:MAG TPA: polysaccharide deacetylase family protein [Chitinophagaceae bacterium]|jgi:peptidoglycan/xylan/chitin deacetylase (PgdA/CDA1 family)|nr:polysaccharide deacetylase family protein [Chitinophagaceae bacterium]